MPIFTVREMVITQTPYGFGFPVYTNPHYQGNDRLTAEAVYFKRYDELGWSSPPKKTALRGIVVWNMTRLGPATRSHCLELVANYGSPTDDDA